MAKSLGDLKDKVVTVGGSVVELLLTDPGSPIVRPTQDVDVIIEIATRLEYYKLEEQLRLLGFHQRSDERVICRWFGHEIILDVMPDDPNILGFSNTWYRSAMHSAKSVSLPSGTAIQIIDGPHFLATKLEAFLSRGGGDIFSSYDFEDIVILVNGRAELADEIHDAPPNLRAFVAEATRNLLVRPNFLEAIEGALGANQDALDRAILVGNRMKLLQ